MAEGFDIAVIGAGMAGASVAYELAAEAAVLVLEREAQPGYHSTGRSAAMLIDSYGGLSVRRLAKASRPFLERPPAGFAATPLLALRAMLYVARGDQLAALDAAFEAMAPSLSDLRRIAAEELLALAPLLDPAYPAAGLLDASAMAIDVAALHQGYLRGLRQRGGRLVADAEVLSIAWTDGGWAIETRAGSFTAELVVNAAGAWADPVAALAGVAPLGLQPLRRTAVLIEPPDGLDPAGWPMIEDVEETIYVKPEGGALMVSPVDETPDAPGDVQPDELDVAIAIDRYQRLTGRTPRRVTHRWAGLRTFAADRAPVAGSDPAEPRFVWLAGQGGFGIMTAPALARFAAGLILAGRPPEDIEVDAAAIMPARLGRG
jgi:D-arginine dehydrogenase